MTTARDVARAIAEDIYNTTSQSQRNDEYDKYQRKAFYALVEPLIAAALSERERETVERCCGMVCELCKAGESKSLLYKDGHLGWMHLCDDDGRARRCKAHALRAADARRETP